LIQECPPKVADTKLREIIHRHIERCAQSAHGTANEAPIGERKRGWKGEAGCEYTKPTLVPLLLGPSPHTQGSKTHMGSQYQQTGVPEVQGATAEGAVDESQAAHA